MTNNTTLYQLNTISDTEVLKNAPCLLPGISFQKCQLSGPNLVRKKHNYTDFESILRVEKHWIIFFTLFLMMRWHLPRILACVFYRKTLEFEPRPWSRWTSRRELVRQPSESSMFLLVTSKLSVLGRSVSCALCLTLYLLAWSWFGDFCQTRIS